MASALVLTPALIAGIFIACIVARNGSPLQGDIAMAIFLGFVPFQCLEPPRTAPEVRKPHDIIQLDSKLLDACIGEYEMVPDNVFLDGAKVSIWRNGDHLVWQAFRINVLQPALDLCPESETNFFLKINRAQVTFIKDDKGEVRALIHHEAGLPDSEGKKLKKRMIAPLAKVLDWSTVQVVTLMMIECTEVLTK